MIIYCWKEFETVRAQVCAGIECPQTEETMNIINVLEQEQLCMTSYFPTARTVQKARKK